MHKISGTEISRHFCFFAWLQIFVQVLFPLVPIMPHSVLADSLSLSSATSSPFSTVHSTTSTDSTLPYAGTLNTVASSLSSSGKNGVVNSAKSAASGYTSSTTQQWLSQFGTARVQLNIDDSGNWDESAIDFLAPLYDNKNAVLFTQLGLRAPDGRTTGNIGMGVRTFYTDKWMFGGNVFFDDDFTGKNRRVGIGAEAWTDYLKLSANTYIGTTEWHSSRDFEDYNEKPADGYDIRAEGYLPTYPLLGARAMYEQYYGNDVALFDKDHLQSNPSAITVGLNYTPVPLVTAGIDYKHGQDSMDETRFSLNFHYTLGQSWQSQMSSDQVALRRSLAGSRYDLVERNNEIILQYKKKDDTAVLTDMTLTSVKDNSPADGIATNTVTLHAITSDNKAASNASITWAVTGSAKLSTTTSMTDANGNASVNLTSTTAEQVIVSASSGTLTRTMPSSFSLSVASLNLNLTKNNSQADGNDQNIGQVVLKDASGKVLSGVAVAWQVDSGATIVSSESATDSDGEATINFTSKTVGPVKLSATAGGKTESVNSAFINQAISNVTVSMNNNNAPADGNTANVAQAVVTESNGQPMVGVSVTWSLGVGSAKPVSPLTVITNSSGIATLNLTDTVAQDIHVAASAGDKTGNTTATFAEVPSILTITMSPDNSPADGSTQNVAQITVTRAGNPVEGASVQWRKSSANAQYASATATSTNAQGVATLSLTDLTAEQFTVTATVNGSNSTSVQTTFTPTDFGPIAISIPEAGNPLIVSVNLALDGVDVVVAAYNNMTAGDQITVSSVISGDEFRKTLPYTSPIHIVSSSEVGQNITLTIPSENLMKVEGGDGQPKAQLNVRADITKGTVTKSSDTLKSIIDTCAPGDTGC